MKREWHTLTNPVFNILGKQLMKVTGLLSECRGAEKPVKHDGKAHQNTIQELCDSGHTGWLNRAGRSCQCRRIIGHRLGWFARITGIIGPSLPTLTYDP